MTTYGIAYSRCCKCGSPVRIVRPIHLTSILQDAPNAICSLCDKRSSWKRVPVGQAQGREEKETKEGGQNIVEAVRCNKCGAAYTDEESVDLVKKWKSEGDGYAPCPNIPCDGQMELWDSSKLIHE